MTVIRTPEDIERRAYLAMNEITMESLVSANLVDTFRNTFPKVSEFVSSQLDMFKLKDATSHDFEKRTKAFATYKPKLEKLNFVKIDEELITVPQGLKSKYVPYLRFLNTSAAKMLEDGGKMLEDYYRVLSVFISSKDAKTSLRDHARFYEDTQKLIQTFKAELASHFNDEVTTTVLPIYSVFDRPVDISDSVELAKQLDKVRQLADKKDTVAQVTRITELLELIIKRSSEGTVEAISPTMANNISQGALAVGQYVELMGVIRYRLEEAIAAVGQTAEKIVSLESK